MAGNQQAGGRYGQPRRRAGQAGGSITKNPNENPQQFQGQGGQQQQPTGDYQDYSQVMGGGPGTPQGTGIQMPQQFYDANQMYQNSATNPWFGQAAAGYGQAMNQGPVTDEGEYQLAYGNAQQANQDDIKQMVEKVMKFGGRGSTGTGRNVADITSRNMGNFQQSYLDRRQQALQANRQNQMNAMGGLVGAASGYGANQQGAAGGMGNLAGMQNQYGLNLAGQLFNQGSGMYGQQNQQAQDLGNYWQGNQWYSNPALQGLQQGSQYSPEYMYPQYKQSTVGQGLNILGSIFG
jgi:hypothetical protein